jgi:hypothetical protein
MTNRITVLLIFLFVTFASGVSGYASGKDASLVDRVHQVLGVPADVSIGTPAFNDSALAGLKSLGSRKELIETVIERAEAVDLGVKLSYHYSHIFFHWEEGEGDMIVKIDVQVGLDKELRPKFVDVGIARRPAPPPVNGQAGWKNEFPERN